MDTGKPRLKKIKIEDLEVGMFIVNMERSWLKHPFLTGKKMITSEKQIEKLRQYGVQEVYIDPERGLDVMASQTAEKNPDPPVQAIVGVEEKKVLLQEPTVAAPQTNMVFPPGSHKAEKNPDPPVQAIVGVEEKKVLLQEPPVTAQQTNMVFPPASHKGDIISAKEIAKARLVQRDAQIVIRDVMQDVRLGKNIESERVKRVVNNMIDSILSNQAALASLTRIKDYDEYTFVHSISVCILCLILGRHLNFTREELEEVGIGALLHDVGKMRIPPHILNKPGKLTDEEFDEIKKHPLYTLEFLEKSEGISEGSKQVGLQHHERYNGRGYPHGLRGEEIGRFGQVGAIIDFYDEITSDRFYKKAIPLHEGIRMIYQGGREDFNQLLVERFIQCVGIYPTGTLVLLDSGEIGIVCAVNQKTLLRPDVMLIYRDSKTLYPQPFVVDLMDQREDSQWFKRTIVMPLDSRQWNIHVDDFLYGLEKGVK